MRTLGLRACYPELGNARIAECLCRASPETIPELAVRCSRAWFGLTTLTTLLTGPLSPGTQARPVTISEVGSSGLST